MYDLSGLRPSARTQINNARIPDRFVGLTLDDLGDYQDRSKEAAQKWINLVLKGEIIKARGVPTCGLGLLLVGKPGHGKTTLASVVLQDVVRQATPELWGSAESMAKNPALFVDYPKLLRIQQRAWKEEDGPESYLMDQIYGDAPGSNNIQLLVLDDLGKEHRTASGWAENTFDAVLRSRYNAGLPTIVTTNVPLKNWGDVYGEAMESFAHEAFIPVNIVSTEGDRRKYEG
jgi:DNA replication protein DnaC